MNKLVDIGVVNDITDDGNIIIHSFPDAIYNTDDKLIIYTKDGEMFVAKLQDEKDGDFEIDEFDSNLTFPVPTDNKPAIGVKKILKYGNSHHVIIDKNMMEAGGLKEGDMIYVYLLKVEGEANE